MLAQPHTARRQREPPHLAVHAGGTYQIAGIDTRILEQETIEHHIATEERQHLHVHHEVPDIGYGICLLGHGVASLCEHKAIYAKVEREHEPHPSYRDTPWGVLGDIRRHLTHQPVLHRRDIQQTCQYKEQKERCERDTRQYFFSFAHKP